MRRRVHGLGIVGLIAFSAGAAAALHRLGSLSWLRVELTDPGRWLRVTPAESAAAAILRLVALGVVYWLLGSTLLYVLAGLTRMPAAIRAAGWVTVPLVRRIVDRGLALFLATSAAVGPSAAALAGEWKPPPPVATSKDGTVLRPPGVEVPGNGTELAGEGREDEGASEPANVPTPGPPLSSPHQRTGGGSSSLVQVGLPSLSTDAEPATPSSPDGHPAPRGYRSHHVVAPGDNLWDIAAAHLAAVTARPRDALPVAEIHRYWLRVIAANRDRLRSGDPDLIYPGERIELPVARIGQVQDGRDG